MSQSGGVFLPPPPKGFERLYKWFQKVSNGLKHNSVIEYLLLLTLDLVDDFLLASSLCNCSSVSAGLSLLLKS